MGSFSFDVVLARRVMAAARWSPPHPECAISPAPGIVQYRAPDGVLWCDVALPSATNPDWLPVVNDPATIGVLLRLAQLCEYDDAFEDVCALIPVRGLRSPDVTLALAIILEAS